MSNGCPYHNTGEGVPTIEARKLFHTGRLTQPAEKQYEQYANFAIAFDVFVQGNHEIIIKNIDELYDVGISRYQYLRRMRTILYDEVMMTHYGITLNSGISTFFLILNGIFQSVPDISEEKINQKILYFMGSIRRASLPGSQEVDLEKKYADFVNQLLQTHIPEGYIKTTDEKRTQMPCPIILSENSRDFLKKIIRSIYKYFPVKTIK